jgi:hypothetical protein
MVSDDQQYWVVAEACTPWEIYTCQRIETVLYMGAQAAAKDDAGTRKEGGNNATESSA